MTEDVKSDEAPGAAATVTLGSRFREALVYAAFLHEAQVRKAAGTPYVAHLMAVSGLALEHGASEDVAIAALLHDAVEDQGGQETAEVIRARFGDAVCAIVLGCSDTDVVPKPPWRERKERYLAHVTTAPVDVRLVSLSDKVHNARSILADLRVEGDAVWARFRGGKDGTLWYYRSLVAAFQGGAHTVGTRRLAEELTRVVREIEILAA